MSSAFILSPDGKPAEMEEVYCKDESRELQDLLEENHSVMPGDQMNPENPRKWVLIKREAPVEDPVSGGERWSVDFFFGDQDAVPTLVECKRFKDTRSRREVVGQVLEYAANGHFYWTKKKMLAWATETAMKRGETLERILLDLEVNAKGPIDGYFDGLVTNLRKGNVRLVFFLEKAPQELKSIVEFLNKQMVNSEVLVVEAKQYVRENVRVIVPFLFGYTEQARILKKESPTSGSSGKVWDEESYFEKVRESLDDAESQAIRKLYDFAVSHDWDIRWGKGKYVGSYTIFKKGIGRQSVMNMYSDGNLWVNLGYIVGDDRAEKLQAAIANAASVSLGIQVPDDMDKAFIEVKIAEWRDKVDDFIRELGSI